MYQVYYWKERDNTLKRLTTGGLVKGLFSELWAGNQQRWWGGGECSSGTKPSAPSAYKGWAETVVLGRRMWLQPDDGEAEREQERENLPSLLSSDLWLCLLLDTWTLMRQLPGSWGSEHTREKQSANLRVTQIGNRHHTHWTREWVLLHVHSITGRTRQSPKPCVFDVAYTFFESLINLIHGHWSHMVYFTLCENQDKGLSVIFEWMQGQW